MKTPRPLELVVFDLDYTIWQPEMYQLWGEPRLVEPSKKLSGNVNVLLESRTTKEGLILTDKSGTPIRVFPGASHALAEINRLKAEGHEIQAAVASRTDQPDWARYCMDHLVVEDGSTLSSCFGRLVEISYNDKTHHFRQLHNKTGVPYEHMVFFDNENWNIKQVAKLGVKSIYTPDGMMTKHWEEAKAEFGL